MISAHRGKRSSTGAHQRLLRDAFRDWRWLLGAFLLRDGGLAAFKRIATVTTQRWRGPLLQLLREIARQRARRAHRWTARIRSAPHRGARDGRRSPDSLSGSRHRAHPRARQCLPTCAGPAWRSGVRRWVDRRQQLRRRAAGLDRHRACGAGRRRCCHRPPGGTEARGFASPSKRSRTSLSVGGRSAA